MSESTEGNRGMDDAQLGAQEAQRDGPPGRHVVRTTTPAGRTYTSTAPPLLGRAVRPPRLAS